MTKYISIIEEVTAVTTVAPTFSDTLTLFQPGWADSAPTLHQKFPHGYISVGHK